MAQKYPRPFGTFTLLRPLARGGMGEIFLASAGQVGGFEKLCVIKKVLAEHTDESKAARFLDEAKVVIRLSHVNLVNVFDAGSVEDEFYIAMEFVEGHDLGAVWNRCAEKKARFPVDIALYIVREVCRGLAYAHTYGGLNLVHRDVTPPNILLSYFGEVKLTDFGLARSRLKQEFTAPGIVYGRLAYLSPEQARGTTVDARTDLYSVGIILWELLTGTQLFRVSSADPVTAISVVRNPQIDPPSKRVPRLPRSLDELVMKALAVSPSDRFQTAEELRRAVSVELAAMAPTIDTERVATFMRMLYGDEIEQERARRERLLGRDVAGDQMETLAGGAGKPAPHAPPPAGAVSGEVDAATGSEQRRGVRTRTVAPSLVEIESRPPRSPGEERPPADEEPSAPTVRIATQGRSRTSEQPAVTGPVAPGGPTRGPSAAGAPEVSSAFAHEGSEDGMLSAAAARNRIDQVVDGRYRIKSVIGAGAMGTVYEAEHVEIGRRLALKILHPQFSRNADLVARFRREARAASTIGHPNIVDVTDYGTTADGSAYFVMERLDGNDLGELLGREGPMSPARAVEITLQVCRAAQAAHERGVIHRDLKPENIFLVHREGNTDFVKILDFGIAKGAELEHADGRCLTLPGIAMGTPVYMSPEQASGEGVDVRSDIYAVGAILYEMVTGAPPFDGDDVLDLLSRKATVAPPPPSAACPGVHPALEAVILKALEREPSERPQTMVALERELRHATQRATPAEGLLNLMVDAGSGATHRGSGAIAASPPAGTVVAGSQASSMTDEVAPLRNLAPVSAALVHRRHPGRWIALTLVLVGIGGGVYFGGPYLMRALDPALVQEPDGSTVDAAPLTVPGLADAGAAELPDAAPLAVDAAPPLDAVALDRGQAPVAQEDAGAPPPAVSRQEIAHLLEMARQAAAAGRYLAPPGDSVRDLLARVVEADPKNAQAAALRASVAKSLHRRAEGDLRRRRYDDAEATYRRLYGLNQDDRRAVSGLVRVLLARATGELRKRKYGAVAADAREALSLNEKSWRAHLLLGEALAGTKQYEGAVAAFRRVLELKPRHRVAKRSLARAEKRLKASKRKRGRRGAKVKRGKGKRRRNAATRRRRR